MPVHSSHVQHIRFNVSNIKSLFVFSWLVIGVSERLSDFGRGSVVVLLLMVFSLLGWDFYFYFLSWVE